MFVAFELSDAVFIMLINVKMPTIDSILTFMSMINFMLSSVEHVQCFCEAFQKAGGQGFMPRVGVVVENKIKSIQDSFFTITCICISFFQLTYISIFTDDTYIIFLQLKLNIYLYFYK